MSKITWMYHRENCVTCGRTQDFLKKKKIEQPEPINARKIRLTFEDGLKLLDGMNELYAMKGKKVVHIDLKKEKPGKAELEKLLKGPSGFLRAPTFKVGKTVVVGFDEATYAEIFG
jgi:arsenate reductase-like glutaredoxin family protein